MVRIVPLSDHVRFKRGGVGVIEKLREVGSTASEKTTTSGAERETLSPDEEMLTT